jgi:hypothetical protein
MAKSSPSSSDGTKPTPAITSSTKKASAEVETNLSTIYSWAWLGVVGYAIAVIIYNAYRIRMGAIEEFGECVGLSLCVCLWRGGEDISILCDSWSFYRYSFLIACQYLSK